MYYSDTEAYSNAISLYYGAFSLAVVFLIVAIVLFIIAKVKKSPKKLLRVLSVVFLCLTLIFGVISFTQSKPRCCGEGITYTIVNAVS